MNVLVGFEESGVVRDAFRRKGHNAWSCDLETSRNDSAYHLQMDIYNAIDMDCWDLIILHPMCTALTVAGNHVYAINKPKHHDRIEAIRYTYELWNYAKKRSKMLCLENPQGVLHTNTDLPKPQYIQPYQFGDNASKKTGLTLHNLPKLTPTKRITGRFIKGIERWDNQTDSGQNNLGPSATRVRERSQTYLGIAEAMADQWGATTIDGNDNT